MVNYAAYLSYLFLTAFTAGPNTLMAMSNASKYGFKGGFRFNLGVLLGFFIVMAACAAFTSLLHDLIPRIEPTMICLGAAYILWLAVSVLRDRPRSVKKRAIDANSVLAGMALQFVNVKVILYGITGMSTFVLPYHSGFASLLPFALLMSLIGFAGTCCWALFGAAFQTFLSQHRRIVNASLALMLAYCAASQVIGLF